MANQYQTGEYWNRNAGFHEEDSDFKFQNFHTLLKRNPDIPITRIVDMGCGAGRITWNFAQTFSNTSCIGVDLDPAIISYAGSKYVRENLSFQTANQQSFSNFNLVVLADVFEHVEDYIGLLAKIRNDYSYQLFNIPLDLSIRTLFRNGPVQARNTYGHLHFFYDKLALKTLEENGFRIIDYLYTDNIGLDLAKQKGMKKLPYFIKSLIANITAYLIGQSRTSLLFGYSSLSVLCASKDTKQENAKA
jgi:SAM-dependent methyltransferase